MPQLSSSISISIAMTTYNGGTFLREQLESISSQSLLPDELVVCDDGSSDDTTAILEEFRGRVPFAVEIVRNESRLGYARNFEKAIGACKCDLVFPCDQDDVWRGNKLLRHASIYEADPEVGMVFNNARYIDAESRPLPGTLFDGSFGRLPHLAETSQSNRAFTILAPSWKITAA